ncbi:Uncharacterised protein [Shigella sonnei]|nr:Uncharacterised protein [Shigella sonnei]
MIPPVRRPISITARIRALFCSGVAPDGYFPTFIGSPYTSRNSARSRTE